MAATDRFSIVADLIKEQKEVLAARAASLGVALPNLIDGLDPVLEGDAVASKARELLIDATAELNAIVKGPKDVIQTQVYTIWGSLHTIARFNIAATVPLEGDEGRTFEQIANASGLDTDTIKRVIRHAATQFVFREDPKGVVKHTAGSRLLGKTPEMGAWLLMTMEDVWPALTKIPQALAKWPGAQEPDQTGFQLSEHTTDTLFDVVGKSPERAQRFGHAMTWQSRDPGLDVAHLATGYPWQEIPKATVVDVGGSFGAADIAVARLHPDIQFIVQDRPEVVAGGEQVVPSELASRIKFQATDFFKEQPVQGATVYFLRQVLHDWSDKWCETILKHIVGAMTADSKLVVMEQIVPEPGETSRWAEQQTRGFDISLLSILNAREREVEDFKTLFSRVDPRLVVTRVFRPEGSRQGIIEAQLRV